METIRGTHDLEKEFSSQWESVNAAAVTESTAALLKDVYQALEASQITDQDIWEGSPEIFPILKHFSAQLQTAADLFPVNVVNFYFPKTPEFSHVKEPCKAYKVDKHIPIYQIAAMICKKLGVENYRKYTLCTIRGFVLNEKATLASYGLGSLLKNWQLKLISLKRASLARQASRPPTEPPKTASVSLNTEVTKRDDKENAPQSVLSSREKEHKHKIEREKPKEEERKREDERRREDEKRRGDERKKEDERRRGDERKRDDEKRGVEERKKDDEKRRGDERKKDDEKRGSEEGKKEDERRREDERKRDERKREEEKRKEEEKKSTRRMPPVNPLPSKSGKDSESHTEVTSPRHSAREAKTSTRLRSGSKDAGSSPKPQAVSTKGATASTNAPIPPPIAKDVVSDEVDIGGKKMRRYAVLFLFEEPQFKVKSQRALLSPALPAREVVAALCETCGVPDPEKYVLVTFNNVILDPQTTLESYGLGVRFKEWQLLVLSLENALKRPGIKQANKMNPKSKYAWIQIEESGFSLEDAVQLIMDLENKMEKLKQELEKTKKKIKKDKSATTPTVSSSSTADLEKQLKTVETERDRLKDLLETTKLERETLQSQIQSLAQLQKKMKEENEKNKAVIEAMTLERETLHSQLTKLAKLQKQDKDYYEKQLKNMESQLTETMKLVAAQQRVNVRDVFPNPEKQEKKDHKKAPSQTQTQSPEKEEVLQLQVALEKSRSELEALKLAFEHNKDTSTAEIEGLKQELQTYQEKLESLTSQHQKLQEELFVVQSQLEQTQKDKEVLEEQLKEEIQKVEEKEKTINELKEAAKNSENNATIKKIKQQLKKKYESKYNELEDKLRQTMTELESMKDQTLDLRQKLKLLQWEKELAEKRLEELQQIHGSLKKKLNKDISNLESLLRAERMRNATADTIQKKEEEAANTSGVEPSLPPPPPPPPPPLSSAADVTKESSGVALAGDLSVPPPPPPPPPPPSVTSQTSESSSLLLSPEIISSARERLLSPSSSTTSLSSTSTSEVESPKSLLDILNSARAKLKTVVKIEEKPRALSPLELTLQKRFMAMQDFDDAEELEKWSDEELENPSFESDDDDTTEPTDEGDDGLELVKDDDDDSFLATIEPLEKK